MPFSPLDLSPTMWLKADALALSDGDPVATWADSSGNGHSASQVTAGRRPVFHTNVQNGKPVVRFTAADNNSLSLTTLGTALSGASHSWLLVFKPILSNAPVVLAYPVDVSGWSYLLEYAASGDVSWASNAGGWSPFVIAAVAPHILALVAAGSGHAYKTGVEATSGAFGAAATPVMTGDMQLGNYANGVAYSTTGDFCEILAFDRALSDADRQEVEGYLAWKWGLQGSLPVDHPWKATNPAAVVVTGGHPGRGRVVTTSDEDEEEVILAAMRNRWN